LTPKMGKAETLGGKKSPAKRKTYMRGKRGAARNELARGRAAEVTSIPVPNHPARAKGKEGGSRQIYLERKRRFKEMGDQVVSLTTKNDREGKDWGEGGKVGR